MPGATALKLIEPKSTVCTWQQWQVQKGGHRSPEFPWEWFRSISPEGDEMIVEIESLLLINPSVSLHGNKLRPSI